MNADTVTHPLIMLYSIPITSVTTPLRPCIPTYPLPGPRPLPLWLFCRGRACLHRLIAHFELHGALEFLLFEGNLALNSAGILLRHQLDGIEGRFSHITG